MSASQAPRRRFEKMLSIRLTEEDFSQLTEDALVSGLPMADLVRKRYLGKPIIASSDLLLIRELHRLGGLLKLVHTESQGAYSEQTSKTLSALLKAIERIGRDRQES